MRSRSSREAIGDLADYNLSGSGSGASCSSTCSRHDECGGSVCITTVGQVRRTDDTLTGTDQVTVVADDLSVGSTDVTYSIAVVWVTEDDGTLDERRLVCRQHGGRIVDELSTLTAKC